MCVRVASGLMSSCEMNGNVPLLVWKWWFCVGRDTSLITSALFGSVGCFLWKRLATLALKCVFCFAIFSECGTFLCLMTMFFKH